MRCGADKCVREDDAFGKRVSGLESSHFCGDVWIEGVFAVLSEVEADFVECSVANAAEPKPLLRDVCQNLDCMLK